MTPEELEKILQAQGRKIVTLCDRRLPAKAGQIAKKHFKENFRQGGFVNEKLHPWEPAKRIGRAKGAAGKYKTLMSSRNVLYKSIQYRTEPGKAVVYTDKKSEDYAAVHNEGLHSGRGKGFRMPKRQFMGDSRVLDDKISDMIEEELKKILEP